MDDLIGPLAEVMLFGLTFLFRTCCYDSAFSTNILTLYIYFLIFSSMICYIIADKSLLKFFSKGLVQSLLKALHPLF